MGLLKQYLVLVDMIKKIMTGTITQKDFDMGYNAYIDISLYARKYGVNNSTFNEVFSKIEEDIKNAEQVFYQSKDKATKTDLEAYMFAKKIVEEATVGDMEMSRFLEPIFDCAKKHKHKGDLDRIDGWAYERDYY